MKKTILEREKAAQLNVYAYLPLTLKAGKGSWVIDDKGEEYLDLYGGHAVATTGHCHPVVVARIKKQAETLLFYSNVVTLEVRASAAEKLLAACPDFIQRVFFINSGAEAIENAFKLARKATGKKTVLSFEGGFHGRTLGSVSAAGTEKYRKSAAVHIPFYVQVPWEDLAATEEELKKGDVACVCIEPIQSLGGVRVATPEFLRGLRHLCDQYGALLVYDELQTGMGRTGRFLYAGKHGVKPDLVTLGKGMGSGVPLAAVLTTEDVAKHVTVGDMGTTFGGGPLAMAALEATLDVMAEEKLMENVLAVSAFLVEGLKTKLQFTKVVGEGFLLGLHCVQPAKTLQGLFLEKKFIVGTSDDPHVLRLMPPLTLSKSEANSFLESLN